MIKTKNGSKFWSGVIVGGASALIIKALIDSSARKTCIANMRGNILSGQQDPSVRQIALKIVDGTDHRDWYTRLERIYMWMSGNLKWKPDPASIDRPAPLLETLKLGGGDCDCLTTAFCTLAEAVGHKTYLLVVPKNNPTHVLSVVQVPASWASMSLKQKRDMIIVLTSEGTVLKYWLPFDPSLRQGKPGMLSQDTIGQIVNHNYQILPIRI